jgi:hypothetical protein
VESASASGKLARAHARDLWKRAGQSPFQHKPALKPLREAYAAAKFTMIRAQVRPCKVRLIDPATEFPDFEIRFDDAIEQFEQTEADREGRRRGDEYSEADRRVASGAPAGLRHYDPNEEMAAAPQAISVALGCKAKKHYQPRPNLLVYVNFPTDNGRPPLTDFQAVQLVEPYRETFLSIWLLWGDNAVRCLPFFARQRGKAHGGEE